jgi:hypothetical protein
MSSFTPVYNSVKGFMSRSLGMFECKNCKCRLEAFCIERLSKIFVRCVPKGDGKYLKVQDGMDAKPKPCLPCLIWKSDKVHFRRQDHMREQHVSFAKLDDQRGEFYDHGEANRLRAQACAKLCQLLTEVPCPGKEKEGEKEEISDEETEDESEEEPALVPVPDSDSNSNSDSEEERMDAINVEWNQMDARLGDILGRKGRNL